MKLLNYVAAATVLFGLTLGSAMANNFCGYDATATLNDSEKSNNAFYKRQTALEKAVKLCPATVCTLDNAYTDAGTALPCSDALKSASKSCHTAGQDKAKHEDSNRGKAATACLLSYNLLKSKSWPTHYVDVETKAAEVQAAKEKACDDVTVPSNIVANSTPNAVCACRNKYPRNVTGDTQAYDATAKTLPAGSESRTRTWLINTGINKMPAGDDLVNALNCCQLLNGNSECKDAAGNTLPYHPPT